MSTVERIFQAIFFEVIALLVIVPITVWMAGYKTGDMLMVSVGLSLMAVFWGYVYNLLFDQLAGYKRIARGLWLRCLHAVGFEFGMLFITFPVLVWYLNITWLEAASLEVGLLIFILIYTFIFNKLYDKYQPYQKWIDRSSHV